MTAAAHPRHLACNYGLAAFAMGLLGVLACPAPVQAQEAAALLTTRPLALDAPVSELHGDPSADVVQMRPAYQDRDSFPTVHEGPAPLRWNRRRWVVFAGGGEEALIWSPASRDDQASFRYRDDRIELGDVHAGFGLEAGGATLSLSYVEKDFEARFGAQSVSYAGLSATWRR